MEINKRNLIKGVILFILTLTVIFPSHATKQLRIIGEDSFPPFNYYLTDGKKIKKEIRGFTVELIKLILNDIGSKKEASIELLPWARALTIIENEPNILILDIVRNSAREEHYKWVGPIAPREIWLYKLKSRKDIQVTSIADIKNYRVGVMRGSSSSEKLINAGFEEGNNLAFVTRENQNINKIIKGRVDLVTFSPVELEWRLKLLTPEINVNIFEPAYLLSGELEYYFALSKKTSNKTLVQLQEALDKIKKDGRYQTLWKKYME
ncbi:ABC transporter substrate-binding protein [Colwellia sp. Bg11-12]|jgi:polar amino acid transport system substrate-binding protein|uniref:substrate-binding periplasmic protein n=1 Tax=Colwellia sp. Bg11-12 TaxID=2759817 RepID=UPI0015F656BC|nr:ABC transporter substrate-binding protein [Colwellia sp. Bg11-12]MBA6262424.1 ABC transporter substrate-binding protein [Colwellia sp. Bg11-12]